MDIQSDEDVVKVRTAKTALDRLEKERAEGVIRASKVRYVEEGEKCTAYFYACVKRRGDTSNVDKLLVDGRVADESGEVETIIHNFHRDLYQVRPLHPSADSWARLIKRISRETREGLEAPILQKELKNAVKNMANKKSPWL